MLIRAVELGIDGVRFLSEKAASIKDGLTQAADAWRGIKKALYDAALPPEPPSPQWEGWDWSGLEKQE
jgi:hypothetical protein